jgi:hypothetical protein
MIERLLCFLKWCHIPYSAYHLNGSGMYLSLAQTNMSADSTLREGANDVGSSFDLTAEALSAVVGLMKPATDRKTRNLWSRCRLKRKASLVKVKPPTVDLVAKFSYC